VCVCVAAALSVADQVLFSDEFILWVADIITEVHNYSNDVSSVSKKNVPSLVCLTLT